MTDEKRLYRESTGKEPRNLPDDHPDAWQWKYRGSKAEREALMARLGLLPRAVEDEEQPQVIDGQEELF